MPVDAPQQGFSIIKASVWQRRGFAPLERSRCAKIYSLHTAVLLQRDDRVDWTFPTMNLRRLAPWPL
jgi:hypothetical protein